MVATAVVLTGVVALLVAWAAEDATTPLRHLYLLPALGAALGAGAAAGAAVGVLGALVHALLVFRDIELAGLTPAAAEHAVTLGLAPAAGGLVGALKGRVQAGTDRLAAVAEIERSMAEGGSHEAGLAAAAAAAGRALGAGRLALVLADGDALRAFGAASPVHPASAAAWALRHGGRVQSRDLDGDPRFAGGRARPAPVRALVLPLRAPDGEVIGALAAEWDGRRPDPAVAEELARVLALALANTRLRQRQARFALELEERVHAATATLQSLDRARGNFLSTVSHELRTPLTALRGFSELLLARAVPGEQARRFLEHIHAESGRLARIVEDLLDLARIDAGQAPALAPERLDLVSLVDANLELFAVAHAAHRFERVGGGPALAWADRDAMDRVLKNLLSNAVKYSPRGGRVRVCLAAAAAAGTVALAVEDEGVGIPPEGCRRIFERYVRLGHPDTAGVRGLGLGLAMVRGLVEAQGGTIEVRSQPGRGSCFTVRLPAAP